MRAALACLFYATLGESIVLAQSDFTGTDVRGVYQGGSLKIAELTGTLDGKHLQMARTFYAMEGPVDITVDGTLNGSTLSYVVEFYVASLDMRCTAVGSAIAYLGEIRIPLDNMSPDNKFCHQTANAGYRRNMTIELPPQ